MVDKAKVEEILDEPYFSNGFWFRRVKLKTVNGMIVRSTLMKRSEEKINNVAVGDLVFYE